MIINSKFRVLKKLGFGRSNVFLVEDLEHENRLVALKLISKDQITSDDLNSLKNEFRLLSGLNHPNIVQVYEFGRVYSCDDPILLDSYFYTSEYIAGKNLIEFFDSPLKLSDLDKFYFCLKQICEVLYYIHQLNIIHFDIKPDNFLIVESYDDKILVKLIDFGFSIKTSGGIKGTPAYISPELILNQSVDFRTDLYSLGATLYHTIMGKPPFEASNDVDLLKHHLESSPLPISDNFPESLNKLVLKLLSKNPQERFKNSLEILDLLPEKYQKINNLWPLPKILYSRKNELNYILDFFSNSNKENGSLLLYSEEGMGKSFLIKKVIEHLDDREFIYLIINGEESRISPYNLLYLLVKQIESIINNRKEKDYKELIYKIDFVTALFKESESKIDSFENLRNHIAEILIEFAKTVNYSIIIDDFHLLDQITRTFITYIYPSLTDLNVKFLVSLNLKFIQEQEFKNFSDSKEIILVPLNEKNIYEMLKNTFHFDFPYESVTQLIMEYTDLSITVINEFLNNLFLTDVIQIDKNGFQLRIEKLEPTYFKKQIQHIHQKKLEILNEIQKEIVEYISFLLVPVKLKLINEIIGLDYDRLKNEILFLASLGWVEYSKLEDTVFLSNNNLRNYIRDESVHKVEICLKFAKLFEAESYPLNIVAEYYAMAGDTKKAFENYLKAIKEAESYYSFSTMENYLKKCLTLDLEANQILELKYLLTKCYFNQSEFKNAEILANDLIRLIPEDKEKLYDLYLKLAIIKYKIGEIKQAYEYFDHAHKYAITDEQKIEVEINQINLELNQGNYELVKKKCENLLLNYELSDSFKAALLNNLGITYFKEDNFHLALINFENSLSIYKKLNNTSKISQQYINMGNVYSILQRYDEANKYWDYSFNINKNIGDLSKNALIMNNKGISAFDNFDFESAVKYYEESRELFKKIGDTWGENIVLFNLSEANLFYCEYSNAYKYLSESIKLSKKMLDLEGLCSNLFLLGIYNFIMNKIDKMKEIANELKNVIEENKLQVKYFQNYLYLEGLIDFLNNNYDDAEIKFNLAKEVYFEIEKKYFYCRSMVDLMWTNFYLGNYDEIIRLKNELLKNQYFQKNTSLQAETLLIIGEASKRPGANINVDPLPTYLEALRLIENSHISEITWQILIAVGEEYFIKGAISKGLEYFSNAKKVIDYIVSKINENDYRISYLAYTKRKRAIEKISKVLNSY